MTSSFGLLFAMAAIGVVTAASTAWTVWRDARRRRSLALSEAGVEPAAANVPKVLREPDVDRARRALEHALVLLVGAQGTLATPMKQVGQEVQALDTDVLDAVQDLRDALGLLREAAEHDPRVDAVFAERNFHPWTEPREIDVIHVRLERAGPAFHEVAVFASIAEDVARRAQHTTSRAGDEPLLEAEPAIPERQRVPRLTEQR